MKKNLRIVSAAAAALLAVAPVAATVVPAASTTVSAATGSVVNGDTLTITKELTNANAGIMHGSSAWTGKIKAGATVTVVSAGSRHTTVKYGTATLRVNTQALLDYSNKNNDEAANMTVYTKADKTPVYTRDGSTFTRVNANISKNEAFTVSSTPVQGSTGVNYYRILSGSHAGQYLAQGDVQANALENEGAYFATANGNELANDATVYATNANSKAKTIAGLKQAIMNTVNFMKKDNTAYKLDGWNKYVFNDNATNDANLISQLKNAGIAVNGEGDSASFNAGATTYSILVRSNNGKRVTIVFQNTDAVNETAPAFAVRSDYRYAINGGLDNTANEMGQQKTSWSYYANENKVVPTISLVQRDSGTFNPRDYIKAVNNVKSLGLINFDIKSNNVDWTKPGLYSVQVSATNAANKTTELTIPVVVSDANGKMMTAIQDANVYKEENGSMVQANLVNFNMLHTGSAVRVYGSAVTKKLNGQDVQFYRLVSPTTNLWVRADALKNGVVSTPAQETTKTVTIMHISAIYDKNGVATHDPALRAYDTYSVVSEPVTINGAKFYKLAGKDQYIKVGNVDGTSRSLKHNSYVYKSTGKRRGKTVLKKGSSVTTYGKSFMIAGHQMYRIGKNQYVKKANF